MDYRLQVIVTGHYGCGGISTAIASPSPELEESIEEWVQPIRDLYATSERPEIVQLRTANAGKSNISAPANDDPGMSYW
jgi:carbonic anhydrase